MKTLFTLPLNPIKSPSPRQKVKGIIIVSFTFILLACFEYAASAQIQVAGNLRQSPQSINSINQSNS